MQRPHTVIRRWHRGFPQRTHTVTRGWQSVLPQRQCTVTMRCHSALSLRMHTVTRGVTMTSHREWTVTRGWHSGLPREHTHTLRMSQLPSTESTQALCDDTVSSHRDLTVTRGCLSALPKRLHVLTLPMCHNDPPQRPFTRGCQVDFAQRAHTVTRRCHCDLSQ
jgi:hypothetical protein